MKKVIIIGVEPDCSKFYFKPAEDFSFTPWQFDVLPEQMDCIHETCLKYIDNNIFMDEELSQIEDLDWVCSKNDYTNDVYTDVFIYRSDKFFSKINCDFLIYDENILDFDFNLINSWIISYIYNKYSLNHTKYIF